MKTSTIKNTIFYISGIVLIILVWWIFSKAINNDLVIPTIKDTLRSLKDLLLEKKTYFVIFNTIIRLSITLLIGLIISLVLALFSYIFTSFKEIIAPIITLMRIIPVATIIIILLMIIGNKNSPYLICLLVVVPIIYEALLNGFLSIDKGIIEEVKMISKTNFQVIKSIYIPLIYPHMLSSVISSFGLGLKVMVMAEFIAQTPDTIGYQLNQEKIFLEINNVFAWTIILIIFMLVIEYFLKLTQKNIILKN